MPPATKATLPRSWRRKRGDESCPMDGGVYLQIAAGVFRCNFCGEVITEDEE